MLLYGKAIRLMLLMLSDISCSNVGRTLDQLAADAIMVVSNHPSYAEDGTGTRSESEICPSGDATEVLPDPSLAQQQSTERKPSPNAILDLLVDIIELEESDLLRLIEICHAQLPKIQNFPKTFIHSTVSELLLFDRPADCDAFIMNYLDSGEERLTELAGKLSVPASEDAVAIVDQVLVRFIKESREIGLAIENTSVQYETATETTVRISNEVYAYTKMMVQRLYIHEKSVNPDKACIFELDGIDFGFQEDILGFLDKSLVSPGLQIRFKACRFKDMIFNISENDQEKWDCVSILEFNGCKLAGISECLTWNSKLLKLEILNSELQAIPSVIYNMASLRFLKITNSYIRHIEPEIRDLRSLISLNLRGNLLLSLPREIGELKELRHLSLSKNRLVDLPNELTDLKNLVELDLGNNLLNRCAFDFSKLGLVSLELTRNNMHMLPPSIADMRHLKKLKLDYNHLRDLPETFHTHLGQTLEVLTMSYNNLRQVPTSIQYLEKLNYLQLDNNSIFTIPSTFLPLKSIKKLSIAENSLGEVPEYISTLITLEILILCNNGIEELPSSLENLVNLKQLVISRNKFKEFPSVIVKKLRHLEKLYLCRNKTKPLYIPDEIGEMKCLKGLYYDSNDIDYLPASIVQLKELVVLEASGNQLRDLPEDLGVNVKLVILDIMNNKLPCVPKALRGMESSLCMLSLGKNVISEIPDWLKEFKALRAIELGHCKISEITTEFPPNLEELLLCGNRLEDFPAEISKLRHLERLVLGYNLIKELPREIGKLKRLRHFDVEMNYLRWLPEEFADMRSLETFNGRNNGLADLPRRFGKLKRLKCMFLGYNSLRALPFSFCELRALEVLDLCSNNLVWLPNEIGELVSLEFLNVRQNEFCCRMPDSFFDLRNLRTFLYYGNRVLCVENFPMLELGADRIPTKRDLIGAYRMERKIKSTQNRFLGIRNVGDKSSLWSDRSIDEDWSEDGHSLMAETRAMNDLRMAQTLGMNDFQMAEAGIMNDFQMAEAGAMNNFQMAEAPPTTEFGGLPTSQYNEWVQQNQWSENYNNPSFLYTNELIYVPVHGLPNLMAVYAPVGPLVPANPQIPYEVQFAPYN